MSGETPEKSPLAALQKIKDVEEQAKASVGEAREKTAAKIIQAAYDEAKNIQAQHLAEAKKKAEQAKAELLAQAEEEAEKIQKETGEQMEALGEKTQKLKPQAEQQIAKKIKSYLETGKL